MKRPESYTAYTQMLIKLISLIKFVPNMNTFLPYLSISLYLDILDTKNVSFFFFFFEGWELFGTGDDILLDDVTL